MSQQKFRVNVDVGGSFTDLVILNENDGRIQTLKVYEEGRISAEKTLKDYGADVGSGIS